MPRQSQQSGVQPEKTSYRDYHARLTKEGRVVIAWRRGHIPQPVDFPKSVHNHLAHLDGARVASLILQTLVQASQARVREQWCDPVCVYSSLVASIQHGLDLLDGKKRLC